MMMPDLSNLPNMTIVCKACGQTKTVTLLSMMPDIPVCDQCVQAALKWGIERWVEAGAPGHD